MSHTSQLDASPAFLTLEAIAHRWVCSTETVKRAAKREGWPSYRMGGRVIRFRIEEIVDFENRSRNAPPSSRPTPPLRNNRKASGALVQLIPTKK